jgi:hypothetical protein
LSKIVLRKTTSAVFLAIVLVLGTFTVISPSFIVGAQAEPYYGMENNYDKSYGKDNYKSKDSSSVFVKKINCNNVNVNVNGLELNGLPPFLGNLLASDGQDGYGDASSYGSGSYGGGPSGSEGDFKFICINNNNNTVIESEEPVPPTPPILQVPPTPPTELCEDCFTQSLDETQFADFEEALAAGIDIIVGREIIEVNSLLELCTILEGATNIREISTILVDIGLPIIVDDRITLDELERCIAEALDIDTGPIRPPIPEPE